MQDGLSCLSAFSLSFKSHLFGFALVYLLARFPSVTSSPWLYEIISLKCCFSIILIGLEREQRQTLVITLPSAIFHWHLSQSCY